MIYVAVKFQWYRFTQYLLTNLIFTSEVDDIMFYYKDCSLIIGNWRWFLVLFQNYVSIISLYVLEFGNEMYYTKLNKVCIFTSRVYALWITYLYQVLYSVPPVHLSHSFITSLHKHWIFFLNLSIEYQLSINTFMHHVQVYWCIV